MFVQTSYSRARKLNFGTTTVSAFWEARPAYQNFTTKMSYVFTGDMSSDGFSGNDLIYILRDTSEMNFVQFTAGTPRRVHGPSGAGLRAYIQQDNICESHRAKCEPTASSCRCLTDT